MGVAPQLKPAATGPGVHARPEIAPHRLLTRPGALWNASMFAGQLDQVNRNVRQRLSKALWGFTMFNMLETPAEQSLGYVALWLTVACAAMLVAFRHHVLPVVKAPLVTFNIINGDTSYPARHRVHKEVVLT